MRLTKIPGMGKMLFDLNLATMTSAKLMDLIVTSEELESCYLSIY